MIRESKDCSCSVNHIVCMFGEILRSKSKQGAPDIYERKTLGLKKSFL
mgnify:FL=1